MLIFEELEKIAKLKRLSIINAEKDYLQDILLFSIYSEVGRELVFKGGTCLYKIYKLDRFSEDLDFTLTKKLDSEKLANKILQNLSLLNIKGRIIEIKEYKEGINIKFILNGPLYKGSKETQSFIPLNISTRENLFKDPYKESFISLYREIPTYELFVMSQEEILAEKFRAILTRLKARDIYDLWFLLVKKRVSFNLELVNNKLSIYDMKFHIQDFKDRVNKMKGLWNTDLKNLVIGELKDFDEVNKDIFNLLDLK